LDLANHEIKSINMNQQEEDRQFRQGRSKEQVKSSYIGASIAMVGLIILSILAVIFSQ